ncbi:MAG: hypothetical protein FJ284_06435 [Planctomycetes bacterium]|nr:hypothetical protein [Planctomycetota bacterium]
MNEAAGWMLPDAGHLAFHAWSMATAAAFSAACALVGSFLVVRRMSLLGDAIAHAVLPGIAIGALAGGQLGGPLVIGGAVAAALLTAWSTRLLRTAAGLAEDAGAGVVFTTMFAAGVVIVTLAAARVDLDPECVLFGSLELVAFDLMSIGRLMMPRATVSAVAMLALVAVAIGATWRWQVFTAFDTPAACVVGVPVAAVTALLLTATAVATVGGFEAVGAVLVVSMLVVPAAAAELLVHRMHRVVAVAIALAVVAACLGWLAAWACNTNAAGMIAVVLGGMYGLAALVAPVDGVLPRAAAGINLAWRVAREDWLAQIWRAQEELGGGRAVPRPMPRSLLERAAVWWLWLVGQVEDRGGLVRLSVAGRREAETVVRSHRLWEAWLGRHADLPLDHLHPPAEWVEHHLGAAVRQRIEAEMAGGPDPHGREIPPESG